MSDNLRDRIIEEVLDGILSMFSENDSVEMAAGYITDAVIAALGTRRCERCRNAKPLTDFPDPHDGSDQMRPYCIPCTNHIEWATS